MNNKEVYNMADQDPDFWDHILKFIFIMAFIMTAATIVGLIKEEEANEDEGRCDIQHIERYSNHDNSAMHAGVYRV